LAGELDVMATMYRPHISQPLFRRATVIDTLIVMPDFYTENRRTVVGGRFVHVTGTAQNHNGIVHLRAEHSANHGRIIQRKGNISDMICIISGAADWVQAGPPS
jgi:hypothetical protein